MPDFFKCVLALHWLFFQATMLAVLALSGLLFFIGSINWQIESNSSLVITMPNNESLSFFTMAQNNKSDELNGKFND